MGINTVLLTSLALVLLKIKRGIPDFEQVFDDFGGSVSEILNKNFSKPAVSKAMSVLGSKSGEARANKALRNKAANAVLAKQPLIKMALEELDISPLEGLQLMNDPVVGPMIQGLMARGAQGLSNMGKGLGGGQSGGHNGSKGVGYGD